MLLRRGQTPGVRRVRDPRPGPMHRLARRGSDRGHRSPSASHVSGATWLLWLVHGTRKADVSCPPLVAGHP